jgi:hypothetical protein
MQKNQRRFWSKAQQVLMKSTGGFDQKHSRFFKDAF